MTRLYLMKDLRVRDEEIHGGFRHTIGSFEFSNTKMQLKHSYLLEYQWITD